MADLYLKRTLTGLAACDDSGADALRRIKVGEVVQCEISRPRNLGHHRKFMALLTVFWNAAGDWSSTYAVLIELKVRLGYVQKVVIRETGEIVSVPKSISFANMDQGAFEEFYSKAVAELCAMAGGIEAEALRQAVLEELAHA